MERAERAKGRESREKDRERERESAESREQERWKEEREGGTGREEESQGDRDRDSVKLDFSMCVAYVGASYKAFERGIGLEFTGFGAWWMKKHKGCLVVKDVEKMSFEALTRGHLI